MKKFTQIYLRLPVFCKCLKWVFQVCLRRFPVGRDFLQVKNGWTFLWVSDCVLGITPDECFCGTLSLVAFPKWFHNNGFLYLYSSKQWQSVSWYNLDKELNAIKDFLKKKWIRHRYQSKTCVEHIAQVIDKSLINSTNSSLIYYIFCIWALYILNIIKSVWEVKSRKF